MSAIHSEFAFETEICADLGAAGWLYTPPTVGVLSLDAKLYDRAAALFPADLQTWIEATQPDAWKKLQKSHGPNALAEVIARLRKTLDEHGTLHVLRNGFEMLGLNKPISVAQFKPALSMNPDLEARYAANRLRVVRQVQYSVHNGNELDLVLFLNGLPMATVEIKTDYTQAVEDAVYQYKRDRNPKVAAKNLLEPLLAFPGGALVHFALSNSEVRMTSKLAGMDTFFLPFNQGNQGGAGNPPNPFGYATAYLWKQVWQRDSWLELLGRYIVGIKDEKKRLKSYVFPRFHQLDATRKVIRAVLDDGPGDKYLIQHSAGSGKTHSIAWTAHFLGDLHDAKDLKVFDSVIVVSDRTVLDEQLQEALDAHQKVKGVVAFIQGNGGSKSSELSEALAANKKIIVCTLQTFPFALKKVQELSATEGKRFAVIADEAHSSQTNKTAAEMKVILSDASALIDTDVEEIDAEEVLNAAIAAQMEAKAAGKEAGITYVAFTATPKDKTLQLFGTRPNPALPPSDTNIPRPFHVYSMRQAIEEGFILDVLQNYTNYKVAFQIANAGAQGQLVEEGKAKSGIMGWVALHEYNIAQHVQIVVEHFRQFVEPLLAGQAKAMVVTASRLEAARWQVAVRKYIKAKGYKLDTVVAFSGDVTDTDISPDPLTETSKILNPKLNGQSIRKAFASRNGQRGDYALLLVANKFQTGFDEPLLCGMYVHKRLDGIQAVQTLSRLNRAYPGKDTTYVVDFVNDPTEILAAFKQYYETAELSGVTDPHLIYSLRAKLDGTGYYSDSDVSAVAAAVLTSQPQSKLDALLVPISNRLLALFSASKTAFKNNPPESQDAIHAKGQMEDLWLFKRDIGTFVRMYGFLCQIFDFGNTDIDKRSIFFKLLHRLLTFDREVETVDLSQLALTHFTIKDLGAAQLILSAGEPIPPTQASGSGKVQDKQKNSLDAIISKVNELFSGEISPNDKLVYVNDVIKGKLLDCEILIQQAVNNTKEQFSHSPQLDQLILDAVMDALSSFSSMSKQALESAKIRLELKEILLGPAGLYEALVKKGKPAGGDENAAP
jgi:type I restriction enzyme R subunit